MRGERPGPVRGERPGPVHEERPGPVRGERLHQGSWSGGVRCRAHLTTRATDHRSRWDRVQVPLEGNKVPLLPALLRPGLLIDSICSHVPQQRGAATTPTKAGREGQRAAAWLLATLQLFSILSGPFHLPDLDPSNSMSFLELKFDFNRIRIKSIKIRFPNRVI